MNRAVKGASFKAAFETALQRGIITQNQIQKQLDLSQHASLERSHIKSKRRESLSKNDQFLQTVFGWKEEQ
jgi:DNA-binding transcriptional regulator/RsmH inhibitor MraZ